MTETYRQSPGEEHPRDVHFDELSPPTQQRLRESFEGRGALLLLDASSSLLGTPGRWTAVAAAGLLPMLAGLGASMQAPLWLKAPSVAAIGAGLAVTAMGAFLAWRRRRIGDVRPGVYLFAHELVDARSLPTLRLVPTSLFEAARPEKGARFSVSFRSGERYSFLYQRGIDRAGELSQQLASLRERAERSGDMADEHALDPFVEERSRWAGASEEAPSKRWPVPGVFSALLASLTLGAALAWPAARAVAAAHDRVGIALATASSDDDSLLRYTFGPRPGFVVVGGQERRAVDALHTLLPSRSNLDLHFALLQIDDPRQAALDEEVLQKALKAGDRAALRRYARLPGRRSAEVLRSMLPRLDLAEARKSTNLRGLWRIIEDSSIDPQVRDEARAFVGELYARERASLREKTRLSTPLSQMADALLVFLATSSHAAEAIAEGHATGALAPEFALKERRINADARKAMVHAFYTHIDPDVFRVRAQSDAEASPDDQSPRLQLLYKVRSTSDDMTSPVSIELTVAMMLPEQESPRRVEMRFVVPAPLEGDAFHEALRDRIAAALKGE